MRHILSFALSTFLLLNGCTKDISCYRDMIIGSWVEQTYDGQIPETNVRGVHTFVRPDSRVVRRLYCEGADHWKINNTEFNYLITCKIISSAGVVTAGGKGVYLYREEEVMRFTDSILRVKVIQEFIDNNPTTPSIQETTYKKVSSANNNAKTIQKLWEMTERSDSTMPVFQILFQANGSYTVFLKNEEEEWEEQDDKAGKYEVYDAFLMTTSLHCWDILFAEKGERMEWYGVVSENGLRKEKSLSFKAVTPSSTQ